MVDFDSVLIAARQLSEDEQLRLIDELWPRFVDDAADPLDPSWQTEIERRVARADAGAAQFVPWETVRQAARRQAGLPDED